jgi:hypothetical protein
MQKMSNENDRVSPAIARSRCSLELEASSGAELYNPEGEPLAVSHDPMELEETRNTMRQTSARSVIISAIGEEEESSSAVTSQHQIRVRRAGPFGSDNEQEYYTPGQPPQGFAVSHDPMELGETRNTMRQISARVIGVIGEEESSSAVLTSQHQSLSVRTVMGALVSENEQEYYTPAGQPPQGFAVSREKLQQAETRGTRRQAAAPNARVISVIGLEGEEEAEHHAKNLIFVNKYVASLFLAVCVVVIVTVVLTTGYCGSKDKGRSDLYTNSSVTPEERPPLFVFLAQNSKYLAEYPDDTTSPQYEAYMWLNDTLLGNETTPDSPFGEDQLLQVFALATLYYATNGDGWITSENWLSPSEHVCNWELGVFSNRTICNEENTTIQTLILHDYGLEGSLPPELSLLSSLEVIDLSENSLTGSIPSALGSLSMMEQFSVARNELSSRLPRELGAWTNIRKSMGTTAAPLASSLKHCLPMPYHHSLCHDLYY